MDNSMWIAYACAIFLTVAVIIYRLLEHRQPKSEPEHSPFERQRIMCPRCDIEMHFVHETKKKCLNCGKIAEIDLPFNALRFRDEMNGF